MLWMGLYPERMGAVDLGLNLDNGNIALLMEGQSGLAIWVVGPAGEELWDMPAIFLALFTTRSLCSVRSTATRIRL